MTLFIDQDGAWRDTTRFSESAPVNLSAIHTRASSKRAPGEHQGTTHMLAKQVPTDWQRRS